MWEDKFLELEGRSEFSLVKKWEFDLRKMSEETKSLQKKLDELKELIIYKDKENFELHQAISQKESKNQDQLKKNHSL